MTPLTGYIIIVHMICPNCSAEIDDRDMICHLNAKAGRISAGRNLPKPRWGVYADEELLSRHYDRAKALAKARALRSAGTACRVRRITEQP